MDYAEIILEAEAIGVSELDILNVSGEIDICCPTQYSMEELMAEALEKIKQRKGLPNSSSVDLIADFDWFGHHPFFRRGNWVVGFPHCPKWTVIDPANTLKEAHKRLLEFLGK